MGGVWNGKGSSRAWRKVRAAVIERDALRAAAENRPNCALRVPGICTGDEGARHVHHKRGADSLDLLDPAELETTCGPCNQHVGDPRKSSTEESDLPAWLRLIVREENT